MSDQPNGLWAIADRHGVSLDAVRHLVRALEAGHGRMAQFNHPDLGGLGQWSKGGMTMIGDMFNTGLKLRVDALCAELASALPASGWSESSGTPAAASSERGWPAEWGTPATSGSQDGVRYAFFPDRHRLAIETDGRVALYDTAHHEIGGVSQQQGSGSGLRFSGRGGPVELASLRRLDDLVSEPAPEVHPFTPEPFATPTASAVKPPSTGGGSTGDVLSTIERLADLQHRGILTDAEFAAKKAELLARL